MELTLKHVGLAASSSAPMSMRLREPMTKDIALEGLSHDILFGSSKEQISKWI